MFSNGLSQSIRGMTSRPIEINQGLSVLHDYGSAFRTRIRIQQLFVMAPRIQNLWNKTYRFGGQLLTTRFATAPRPCLCMRWCMRMVAVSRVYYPAQIQPVFQHRMRTRLCMRKRVHTHTHTHTHTHKPWQKLTEAETEFASRSVLVEQTSQHIHTHKCTCTKPWHLLGE